MPRDRFVVGVPLGRWQTNCYVIGDRVQGRSVVIDPGETGSETVPRLLEQFEVTCEAILLSHGHLDHLWGVPGLVRALDVPVFLHPDDRWMWDDPAAGMGVPGRDGLQAMFGLEWDPPTDHLENVADGDRLTFAGIEFDVAHNPGHTPGHVTYLGRDLGQADVEVALGGVRQATDQILFSGDLVFAGSIGRTDLPRGDTDAMLRSLVETVLPREDDTVILSGHGPATTVGRERSTNPFLAEARQRHPA